MLLLPHRPALNRLLWNLFKYFDISPPLTSRAEMICDSWRWARSEELPLTPCLRFPPSPHPVLLCRKADFLFWLASFYPSSFIHRCSSCQLVKTLKAPLISFRLTPQCDRQTGWYSSICWHLVFAVFFLWLLLSAHLLFDPALTPCLAPQRVILLRLLSESFRGCGATKSLRALLFNQRFIDQLTSEI